MSEIKKISIDKSKLDFSRISVDEHSAAQGNFINKQNVKTNLWGETEELSYVEQPNGTFLIYEGDTPMGFTDKKGIEGTKVSQKEAYDKMNEAIKLRSDNMDGCSRTKVGELKQDKDGHYYQSFVLLDEKHNSQTYTYRINDDGNAQVVISNTDNADGTYTHTNYDTGMVEYKTKTNDGNVKIKKYSLNDAPSDSTGRGNSRSSEGSTNPSKKTNSDSNKSSNSSSNKNHNKQSGGNESNKGSKSSTKQHTQNAKKEPPVTPAQELPKEEKIKITPAEEVPQNSNTDKLTAYVNATKGTSQVQNGKIQYIGDGGGNKDLNTPQSF